LGESAQAIKYFSEIENDYKRPYFSDLVLVKGSLLVENLLFNEALELFGIYIDNYPGGEKTQYIYFLTAACYTGIDNSLQAKTYLQKTVNIDPNSDIGKAAAARIEEL
jgi:outer membrane protein assembly factor BamD (BamD/ComL family)